MARGARLGQNFLKSPWAARVLVHALDIDDTHDVLEIGPGKGMLTKELLQTGARVTAIEIDETLIPILEEKFSQEIRSGQLRIEKGDVRDVDPAQFGLSAREYVLAANIPYYITGEIIRLFLTTDAHPKHMALLVQKEVADRITRSEKESILSLSVKAFGEPRYIETVRASHFLPAPNVDSAILIIENISRDFFLDCNETLFFETVKLGFSSKRKFLLNNFATKHTKEHSEKALERCAIHLKARAEDVPLEKWKCLAKELVKS